MDNHSHKSDEYEHEVEQVATSGEVMHEEPTSSWKDYLPRPGFFITPILILANVLVFVVMLASGVHFMEPTSQSLVEWGANLGLLTLNGEWWRLFTCNYVHIGVIHLAMNMYALLYIGVVLEPFLGKARFLVAYTVTGILSSIASTWWHADIVSAGASGAIFGMYGLFLAMLTTNLIEKEVRKSLLGSIGFFVVFNLAYGMSGNIDNAGHIGGLVSGLFFGYLMVPSLKRPFSLGFRYANLLVMILLCGGISYAFLSYYKNDFVLYQQAMTDFGEHEQVAVSKFPPETVSSSNINVVKQGLKTGVVEWQTCIDILHGIDSLEISPQQDSLNAELIKYASLRKEAFALFLKKYEENTPYYDEEIDQKLSEAEGIVTKMNAINEK